MSDKSMGKTSNSKRTVANRGLNESMRYPMFVLTLITAMLLLQDSPTFSQDGDKKDDKAAAPAQDKDAAKADAAKAAPQTQPKGDDKKDKKKQQSQVVAARLALKNRDPYDTIIDKTGTSTKVEIFKDFRAMPDTKKLAGKKLAFYPITSPDEAYEIFWREVENIEFFEDLLVREARELVDAAKYDLAYVHYDFIRKNYPQARGLEDGIKRFLYQNAGQWFMQGKNYDAMGVLEELYRMDNKYTLNAESQSVVDVLSAVADKIIQKYIADKDYERAQREIRRLKGSYGDIDFKALDNGIATLDRLAAAKRDASQAAIKAGDLRQAQRLSREMLKIWPEVSGATKLISDIARIYPLVTVGVSENAKHFDRSSLHNWSARRAGYLIRRNLMEFQGMSPDYGVYSCPLGTVRLSYDRRQLEIQLSQSERNNPLGVTGYDVAQQLLGLTDPKSPSYDSAWHSLMQTVSVESVYRAKISLRRPSVRPEAYLQVNIAPSMGRHTGGKGVGSFIPDPNPEKNPEFVSSKYVANKESPFRTKSPSGFIPPAEIVERVFPSQTDALKALKAGEIDVVDRLFPADAAENMNDPNIHVVPYAMPTIHILIPNYEKPYTKNVMFRRSVLLAIRRQTILKELLLRDKELPGCGVISGPFTYAVHPTDPSGYAYDDEIHPRKFQPGAALALHKLTEKQLATIAAEKEEDPPKLPTMILAHPDDEEARIICKAIEVQWNALKSPTKLVLKQLPPGETFDKKREYDFLYARIAMWEPLRDITYLLARDGLVGVDEDNVNRALQWVNNARTDRDVRGRLLELHQATHDNVAVIPLFQTVDYFAHRRGLKRLVERPIGLYQDVLSWQLAPSAPTTSNTAAR